MITTKNKKSLSGVYILRNERTGKIYIGSSADIIGRFYQHFNDLEKNRHTNKDLQKDYNNGDMIKPFYYKVYPVKHKAFLLTEEGKTIESFKKKKFNLYNKGRLATDHFYTRNQLQALMADAYCKENYGCNFSQLTGHFVPAEYSMHYEFIQSPDNKDEIRKNYRDVISYQKKQYFYDTHPKTKRKHPDNVMI